MSTPHYDEEYGDPFDRDVAAEFGPEVAHVLTRRDSLVPAHYRLIRRRAERSRDERSEFLAVLETERASLERIDARLSEVESEGFALGDGSIDSLPTGRLETGRERLFELEETCRELAGDRQDVIHDRSASPIAGIGDDSLVEYLYGECDARCPALADIVTVLEGVQRRRRRYERELWDRRR